MNKVKTLTKSQNYDKKNLNYDRKVKIMTYQVNIMTLKGQNKHKKSKSRY